MIVGISCHIQHYYNCLQQVHSASVSDLTLIQLLQGARQLSSCIMLIRQQIDSDTCCAVKMQFVAAGTAGDKPCAGVALRDLVWENKVFFRTFLSLKSSEVAVYQTCPAFSAGSNSVKPFLQLPRSWVQCFFQITPSVKVYESCNCTIRNIRAMWRFLAKTHRDLSNLSCVVVGL